MNLLDANMLRLKKSLDDTKALFKNGFVEKIDVDRLTVLNNNLETERENVRIRLLDLNVNLLKFQIGMSIKSKLTLKGFNRRTSGSTIYCCFGYQCI